MTTKTEIYVLTAQNADGPSKNVKAFPTESDAMDALRKCIEWMATLGERDQSILYRTEGYKPCKALTAMCPWGAHANPPNLSLIPCKPYLDVVSHGV